MTEPPRREIAVVDDDHAVRHSLRFLLEVMGHPVRTFASAGEFLKAEIHHVAALILDHHMPQMSGLELVARLRADGIGIPILLVTGAPSPVIAARAAALGIHRVVEKPPTDHELHAFLSGITR